MPTACLQIPSMHTRKAGAHSRNLIPSCAAGSLVNADLMCMCMCRSLSLTDLLEADSRPTGSPRVASNAAMAAAEAATASALHPQQHDCTASTSTHMEPSPAADAGPADDSLVPDAASFGSPFDSGLHEQAVLLHAAGDESEPPAVDDAVQHLADLQVRSVQAYCTEIALLAQIVLCPIQL